MKTYKDEFLVGRKPIIEAIDRGKQLEKVWIDKAIRGEFEKEVRHRCRANGIPLITSPPSKLNDLVKTSNHQGLVAQLSLVDYHSLADVLPFIFENGDTPRIMLLDGVEDVRNLGAIARSAAWFGFNAIVVPMKESARLNAFAMKASMGALLDMMVCREKSILGAVEFLQSSGVKVCAAMMDGLPSEKVDLSGPIALVLGAEETGVSAPIARKADERISIIGNPDKMESLNVSVAAAILMHEVFKSEL